MLELLSTYIELFSLLDLQTVALGTLLFLFGAALALMFHLKDDEKVYKQLAVLLWIIFVVLCFSILVQLSSPRVLFTTERFSIFAQLVALHRSIFLFLPIPLVFTSAVIVQTYGPHIRETHALVYQKAARISILISFISILVLSFEFMV